MKKLILYMLIMFFSGTSGLLTGQNLEDLLNEEAEEETNYATAAFKATRIMNGHSIERMQAGVLDVRISHRFGRINSGAYEFFGIDQSTIHLGLEYGITDWLMVGIGRTSYQKTVNGFTKISILRQSTGKKNMPIFLSFLTSMDINGLKWENPEITNYFTSRMNYAYQLLIGRKFNKFLSAQVTPTIIHRNLVETELDPNDLFALGLGGRIKLTTRISLNIEYYYVFRPVDQFTPVTYYNPLAIGFDIETGGHVFQLVFTNSNTMIERQFIGETTGKWLGGDIHFGFNISRVFTLNSDFKG